MAFGPTIFCGPGLPTSFFGLLDGGMGGNNNNAILAFLVPFLLFHLGGQDTITAYSMEDNELWARHLLVFATRSSLPSMLCCSPSKKNLMLSTLLIFFVAIVKYEERSYSLYGASTNGFSSSMFISSKQSQLNKIS
ncbi:hypothetical protein HPP92_006501 [Vanilla planifolia]|uniref:DUF4220 domain-containing protein n=1 Tax=Vanilla planifolia TaxID=51239 RepID=A0A835VDA5_VANPL|nr:hypothetical protein HPP92_006501 [Vanilla planifolia]